MTIESQNRVAGPFIGTGIQTDFPFNFKVFQESDVAVLGYNASLGEYEITEYSVTLNPNQDVSPGGVVTMNSPLSTGNTLVITSEVPLLQRVQLTNQGGFYPSVLNGALDRQTILTQQLARDLGRSLKFPVSSIDDLTTLPSADDRAGRLLSFDSNGRPTVTIPNSESAIGVGLALTLFQSNLQGGSGAGQIGIDATAAFVAGTIGYRDTREVFVTDFPWIARPDGSDCTTRINNALAWMGTQTGGGTVRVPRGVFCQTALIKVPANVRFVLDAGAELKCLNNMAHDPSVPGSAHQGQSVALMGNNSEMAGGTLNGNGFTAGGVVASAISNIQMIGVSVKNSGQGTEEFPGAQAFHLFAVTKFKVVACNSDVGIHGIQMWACVQGRVYGCKVNRVVGGIWTAACSNVLVYGNEITNCEDVGLDFEGGNTCYGFGNIVAGCFNAELSIFKDAVTGTVGCVSLVLSNNQVHRTATYVRRDGTTVPTSGAGGAMWFASLNDFSSDVGFRRNDVIVDAGAGYVWLTSAEYGLGHQVADITDNHIFFNGTTALFVVTVRANGLRHNGNTYYINQGVSAGSLFKNVKGGQFCRNNFLAVSPPSNPLIILYSDIAGQQSCSVVGNEFTGCGDNAMYIDQFNSGYGTFILSKNRLTDGPTAHGGLQINVGNDAPRYFDQVLYLSENTTTDSLVLDFDQVQPLRANAGALRPVAEILYVINIGGVMRNSYPMHYLAGALRSVFGVGAASGTNTAAPDYISAISGAQMTVVKATGANTSMIKLTLDSPYVV